MTTFWTTILQKLHDFYFTAVLPELSFQKLHDFYFTAVLPELSFPLGAIAIREPSQEFKRDWQDMDKSL